MKKVKNLIGKMKLSDDVLEDTFMRIAVARKKISVDEADDLFRNLRGVQGFRGNLSIISGVSDNATKGALQELRVANTAKKRGFEVLEIRKKFYDGIKKGKTDIDLLLKKGNTVFPIEVKAYGVPLKKDHIRRDAESLLEYAKQSNHQKIIPLFIFKVEPPALIAGSATFMLFEVDSAVLVQAPPIPKLPQTSSVASGQKSVPLPSSRQVE